MKYALALAACFVIAIVYGGISIAMGWQRGGGAIPMLLFFSALAVTWRSITKKEKIDANYLAKEKPTTNNNPNYRSLDIETNNQETVKLPKDITVHLANFSVEIPEVEPKDNQEFDAKVTPLTDAQNDEFYVKALSEFESETTHKATLAKAIVAADGNPSKERAIYIKLRVHALSAEWLEAKLVEKNQSLELRTVTREKEAEFEKIENEKTRRQQLEDEGIVVDDMIFHSVEDAVNVIKRLKDEIEKLTNQAMRGESTITSIEAGMSYDDIIDRLQKKIDAKKRVIYNIKNAFNPISLKF